MSDRLWTNGGAVFSENMIWFVPAEYACLCQYDSNMGKVIKFIVLEGATSIRGTHYNLLKYKNSIVLIPTRDMNIFIYNIEEEKLHKICLNGKENTKEKFIAGAVWKHYVYMFPVAYSKILRVDMENMHVEYINSASVRRCFENGRDYTQICVTIGETANLLIEDSNKICEFDMRTHSEKIISVGDGDICYKTMCRYGEKGIILSDQRGNIVILNEKKEQVSYISSDDGVYFNGCIPVMDGYLFLPYKKGFACIYLEGRNRKHIDMEIKIRESTWANKWAYAPYSRIFYDKKRAIFFNIFNKSMCLLDRETCKVQEKYIIIDNLEENIKGRLYNEFDRYELMNERGIEPLGLTGFLKYIQSGKYTDRQYSTDFIGKSIYDTLME